MIIYPAIDLKDGKCVRLYKGDMAQETIYNEDPPAQALEWARSGFSWLHVVDLDGAVSGTEGNHEAVRGIIEAVDTTAIMAFKDDIVIRVRTGAQGTMVDLRSVSRVGQGDIGANAQRIRDFTAAFQEQG